jgi:hypothetical protein
MGQYSIELIKPVEALVQTSVNHKIYYVIGRKYLNKLALENWPIP